MDDMKRKDFSFVIEQWGTEGKEGNATRAGLPDERRWWQSCYSGNGRESRWQCCRACGGQQTMQWDQEEVCGGGGKWCLTAAQC